MAPQMEPDVDGSDQGGDGGTPEAVVEAEGRPPQPPRVEAEASDDVNSLGSDEAQETLPRGRGQKRVSEWSESCNLRKCQRCLQKN